MRGRASGLVAAGAILLLMAGCAADKAPPAPLLPVTPTIAGKQVWQQRLDTRVGFPLAVVVRQGQVIAASDQGVVQGLDLATGKEVWRANVKSGLSAGVGSDGRFSAVVTRDNELVTIEAGAERWRKSLDARVVTAPLVAGERVFVVGVDRAVHAYDALDGRKLWTLRRAGDPLTLAQASVLTAYKDTLIVGQGPRLLGVDSLRGTVRWEAVVATPRGTNEVERLADLIGPAARVGSSFCVRAFQSSIGCVDAERGALQWSINGGGTQPVAADADHVFSADAVDRVSARRRSDGVLLWSNERFLNRELSGPVSVGKTVVFGDFEGQVHFLSRETGLTLLRLPTDGSAVVGAPIVADTTLLVVTRNGGLFAFRPE
ncbi:outer membrane protein assembly factor BamB [Ideonella sp.]|uniref:outer membrane protein assembly factor BamB n=1 Tax=Ideonella sp. TaxID=1929293 RepID=UPI003BB734D1